MKIEKQPLLKAINHRGKTTFVPNPAYTGREHRTPVDWAKANPENWAMRFAPDNITQGAPAGVNPKRVQPKVVHARSVTSSMQPVSVADVTKPIRRKIVGSKPTPQQKAYITPKKGRV